MRVAFDPQMFMLQEYGGITRYYCSLARALAAQPDMTVRIVAPLHVNSHLAALPPGFGGGCRVPRLPRTGRLLRLTGRLLSRPALRRFHPDLVHETYYSPDAYAPPGAKRVVTVVDMIHELFPETFAKNDPTSAWKRLATQRADHVLCISESTRRDLLERIDLPAEKVSVVHLGFDLPEIGTATAAAPSRPYLLHVGQRGGYKNFTGLLRAFAGSARLKRDCDLLCFGGGAFTREERALIGSLGFADGQISQRGGDDAALAAAYRAAAAFVYPSLYEGFGIPLLEAMSQGCPVICGNTGSFPEVAGDAAEYFDPRDADSLHAALERLLESPARRDELIRHGRARAAQFSWARCAAETRAVYERVLA